MIYKDIKVPTFSALVTVVDAPIEKFVALVNRREGPGKSAIDVSMAYEGGRSEIYLDMDNGFVKAYIWINPDQNKTQRLGTLIHEITHVVHFILSGRGLKHTTETTEAYAYLTEMLFVEGM